MVKRNTIYVKDALAGMAEMGAGSVDLVVTDPPYNIAAKDKRTIVGGKLMTTMQAFGGWDTLHPFDYDLLINRVLSACYRVLRPGGSLYMFTAREQNGYFIRKAVERGFAYRNQLSMVKKNPLPSLSKKNWRSGFELCLYLVKPIKPKATGVAQSGPSGAIFNFLSQQACVNVYPYLVRGKATNHPTEKPLGFIRRLIEVSSQSGDLVLDPFMGSGTTAVAAKVTGRDYVGFDTNPEYVKMARRRVRLAAVMSTNGTSQKTSGGGGGGK